MDPSEARDVALIPNGCGTSCKAAKGPSVGFLVFQVGIFSDAYANTWWTLKHPTDVNYHLWALLCPLQSLAAEPSSKNTGRDGMTLAESLFLLQTAKCNLGHMASCASVSPCL